MNKIYLVPTALVILAISSVCAADAGTDPVNLPRRSAAQTEENDHLKARIEKLEKELAELKEIVAQQAQKPVTQESVKPVPEKKPVLSGLDVEIYGRLKADAAYDTSRIFNGNFAQWVEPENLNKNDNQFNMTANETRLGMWIYGPKNERLRTTGRVEIDFWGNGGTDNKPNPMIRHVYMNLDWPDDKFSILAGQTSDVISPLWPYTLNYSVAWWVGNIGYRRPQIRLTKGYAPAQDVDLKLEAAAARTMGQYGTFTPGDAGEDAGIPNFQGRAGLTFPWWGYKPTTVGFSGHWGREEFDIDQNGSNRDFVTWSLNLDVTQPVNEWLTLKGEMFHGKNLAAFLGGIGQGVRNVGIPGFPILDKEISSTGGWLAAELGPWDKWSFNAGFGVDDPENDDLSAVTNSNRRLNRMFFGNVIYSIDKNAQVGFELSQWHTEYVDKGNADAIRAQTSFIYKF